tara:strand:- start:2484 stop:2840 length:357 start_codon:yes stop_codon:yes gene_type:complete
LGASKRLREKLFITRGRKSFRVFSNEDLNEDDKSFVKENLLPSIIASTLKKSESKLIIEFEEDDLKDFFERTKKIASKKEDFPAPFLPRIRFLFARLKEEFLKDLKLFKCIFDSDISS